MLFQPLVVHHQPGGVPVEQLQSVRLQWKVRVGQRLRLIELRYVFFSKASIKMFSMSA